MSESDKIALLARCNELELLLKETRKELRYYKNIAAVTGRTRLKEIEQFSNLIQLRNKAEKALEKARDELEFKVKQRTQELVDINEQLKKEIEERKKAEGSLTTQTHLLRNILSNIPLSVFWKDTESVYLGCNDNFAKDAGLASPDDIGGKTDYDLAWKKTEADFFRQCDRKVMDNNTPMLEIEETQLQADGKEAILLTSKVPLTDESGKVIGLLGTYLDITERKKLEIELHKAKKLDSLGVLAGGIAHDFNNYLSAILGNISLSKILLDPKLEAYELLEQSEKACLRAKNLTHQLLTFSKGGEPVMQVICIKELIKDCARFILSGSNVKPDFNIDDDLWSINADKDKIAQVIQNIIGNADHVMPSGGTIQINAQNITVSGQEASNAKDGNYINISILDKGPGIPSDSLEKIFDPYFSTKSDGSGLGLTICYSIVHKHGGDIYVKSKLDHGTVFEILLPAVEEQIEKTEDKDAVLPDGKGKILLMDDEPMVTDVASRILKHMGYDVDTAPDGQKAIKLYQKAMDIGEPFDAVVFDLTVPGGMGGVEAIQALIKIDPKIKAIVSSGYSTDPVMSDFKRYGFSEVLPKPFTIRSLGKVLAKLLHHKKPSN